MAYNQRPQGGFTVIELLISISITSVVLLVVLFNYSSGSDQLAVKAGGQEVAIVIRQAQNYALSVRESSVGSGAYNYAYGAHFNPILSPTTYLIFVDKDNDGSYDVGTGSCGAVTTECVESFSLRNGVRIASVHDGSGTTPGGATGVNITFIRPNPDAVLKYTDSSGNFVSSPLEMRINLVSPRNKTVSVIIQRNGQILAQ